MLDNLFHLLIPLGVVAMVGMPLMFGVRKFHQWKMRGIPATPVRTVYRPQLSGRPTKSHARQ